jgi:hypothetical protein
MFYIHEFKLLAKGNFTNKQKSGGIPRVHIAVYSRTPRNFTKINTLAKHISGRPNLWWSNSKTLMGKK